MKTTILIEKTTAERLMRIGRMLGHKSMSATAEFLIRNSCLIIERDGADAFIDQRALCIKDISSSIEKA